MADWLTLLQTFGLAVVILVFLAFGGWKLAQWLAPRFDKVFDRVISFVDKVERTDDRLNRLESKVETIWEFQLRRATIEAVQHGIGKMNSPLVISQEAKEWMGELAVRLREFYRRLGRTLTNSELALEIERRYGQEIVEKVCIPHGIFQGACLLIAMEVAKEGAAGPQDGGGGSDLLLPPAPVPAPA